MSERAIIGIISIFVLGTGSFLAITLWVLILEQIDRTKPDGTIYSALGFPRVGTPRIVREYVSSHPNGNLHIYLMAALALAMTGMLGLIGVGVYSIVLNKPVVFIASPADGVSFRSPANIVITAETRQIDPAVTRVDFYAGATLIGSCTNDPYSLTWSNVPAGNYSLTAKATDDRGAETTSDVVSITVSASREKSP